ncbi:MAG: hypothetical protein J3R72DRAFT_435657, partial [Linnemannia gamsii]
MRVPLWISFHSLWILYCYARLGRTRYYSPHRSECHNLFYNSSCSITCLFCQSQDGMCGTKGDIAYCMFFRVRF